MLITSFPVTILCFPMFPNVSRFPLTPVTRHPSANRFPLIPARSSRKLFLMWVPCRFSSPLILCSSLMTPFLVFEPFVFGFCDLPAFIVEICHIFGGNFGLIKTVPSLILFLVLSPHLCIQFLCHFQRHKMMKLVLPAIQKDLLYNDMKQRKCINYQNGEAGTWGF